MKKKNKKIIFLNLITIFTQTINACEPAFPNYFKNIEQGQINSAFANTLRHLDLGYIKDDQYQKTSFFENLQKKVSDNGVKLYVGAGVVRSILGYLYQKAYNNAARNAPREDIFDKIAKRTKPLNRLKVLGVCSDLDLYVRFEKNFSGNKKEVLNTIIDFVNSVKNSLRLTDDTIAIKSLLLPPADVQDYDSVFSETHGKNPTLQGGSAIDWLAFDIENNNFLMPTNYPNILKDLMNGIIHYVKPSYGSASDKQTIRGLRPLLELPFVQYDQTSKNILISEIKALGTLSHNAQEQEKKLIRNARFGGAYNGTIKDKDLLILAKEKGVNIPEFIGYQYEKLQKLPAKLLLTTYEEILSSLNGNPVIYHGTPDIVNCISMIRGGYLISNKTQGTAVYGDGFYTTINETEAQNYAKNTGITLSLQFKHTNNLRILNMKNNKAFCNNLIIPFNDNLHQYLFKSYGIDVIIPDYCPNFLLIQNAAIIKNKTTLSEYIDYAIDNCKKNIENSHSLIQSMKHYICYEQYCALKAMLSGYECNHNLMPQISRKHKIKEENLKKVFLLLNNKFDIDDRNRAKIQNLSIDLINNAIKLKQANIEIKFSDLQALEGLSSRTIDNAIKLQRANIIINVRRIKTLEGLSNTIIDNAIKLQQANFYISFSDIEKLNYLSSETIDTVIDNAIKLQQADIKISFSDLKKLESLSSTTIDNAIKLKQANIEIKFSDLQALEGLSSRTIDNAIKLQQAKINIDVNSLRALEHVSSSTIDTVIKNATKLIEAGIRIDVSSLIELEGLSSETIDNAIDNAIKFKNSGIKISFSDLKELARLSIATINDTIDKAKKLQKAKIDVDVSSLIELEHLPSSTIDTAIKLQNFGIYIRVREIIRIDGLSNRAIDSIIKLQKDNFYMNMRSVEEIANLYNTTTDTAIDAAIDTAIKLKQANLYVTMLDIELLANLYNTTIDNAMKLRTTVDNMIKLQNSGVNMFCSYLVELENLSSTTIDNALKLLNSGVNMCFSDLAALESLSSTTINNALKLLNSGVNMCFSDIISINGLSNKAIDSIIKIREAKIDMNMHSIEQIANLYNTTTDDTIEAAIAAAIKLKQANFYVTVCDIEAIKGCPSRIIDNAIKLKNAGIAMCFMHRAILEGLSNRTIDNALKLQNSGVDMCFSDLEELERLSSSTIDIDKAIDLKGPGVRMSFRELREQKYL